MPDLCVEVRDRDIIVSAPYSGLSITYRKDRFAPMLEALDHMRGGLSDEELEFLVEAWKAAFRKAKALTRLVELTVPPDHRRLKSSFGAPAWSASSHGRT